MDPRPSALNSRIINVGLRKNSGPVEFRKGMRPARYKWEFPKIRGT